MKAKARKQLTHAETERMAAEGNLQEERFNDGEDEGDGDNADGVDSDDPSKPSSQEEFVQVKNMQDQLAQ